MQIIETAIPDVKLIVAKRFGDHRGFFSETYNAAAFAAAGLPTNFVQDNHSLSREKGTLRGLHFQLPPMAQDKLVRVIHGSILDVAVDIRRSSPTFGKHVSAVLSADNWQQIWVPVGFAHGFCTLEPDTEVVYKVTNLYSPEHDRGLQWNDPALEIEWSVMPAEAILSDKDKLHPALHDLADAFE